LRPPVAQTAAPEAARESSAELEPAATPSVSHKRPSPSPSFKRGKAEKLLKEHGSPPGLRVTAGGRVVPGDLLHLNSARSGYNAYNPQALRVTSGNTMPIQTQSMVDNTARIEVIGGQPVIVIGDRMFAFSTVNTASSAIPPGVPIATEAAPKQSPDPPSLSVPDGLPALSSKSSRASTLTPSSGSDLQTLKAQQSVKKQELRTVEQTEVLQASQQSEAWRAGMIEKKRSLIVELDNLRKQITTLENKNTGMGQANSVQDLTGAATGPAPLLPLAPQFQQPLPQPMYGFSQASPYPSIMMYQSPYSTFPGYPTPEPAQFVPPPPNAPPRSPNSASRRSRAIEIKPPHEETKKQSSSALDPKSPTYEPVSRYEAAKGAVPPTPSPNKQSPWSHQDTLRSEKPTRQALSTKPSLSSIDTTDFFPTNTHEHSITRVAPQANESTQASKENTAAPSTPERNWPASPWNERDSSRSQHKESMTKLTSWPEAFGKQPSTVSLGQGTSTQPSAPILDHVPCLTTNLMDTSSSKTDAKRNDSGQPVGTEEAWLFSLSKPVTHVPSTYQEGYQAGYDHVGMPDNPEVLQGFIQGLLNFLSDESVKRRNDLSARGMYPWGVDVRSPFVQGFAMSQDSAISMTFKRHEAPVVNQQENINYAKGNNAEAIRRDSVYSQQHTSRSMPVTVAPVTGFVEDSRQRIDCSSKQTASFDPYPKEFGSAYRHGDTSSLDAEANKTALGQLGGEAQQTGSGFGRAFFGTQLTNGAHTTRMPMQRLYLSQKELDSTKIGQDSSSCARLPTSHRLSGLDGAMDDLEELVMDTRLDDRRPSSDNRPSSDRRSGAMTAATDSEDVHASCPRPFSGKNRNKQTSSPTKAAGAARGSHVSSPANPPSPSKVAGEVSPAKARLDQVTNKFRRGKKDDPRAMSPEEKKKRSEKWRQRFQYIKKTEAQEIEQYNRDNGMGN
jgi:hypothetical protein